MAIKSSGIKAFIGGGYGSAKSSVNYAIDDKHGRRLWDGSVTEYRHAAQKIANQRGESVFAYPVTLGRHPTPEEFKPSKGSKELRLDREV